MTFVSEDTEYHDKRFRALTIGTARKDLLFDKCRWCEGPVWFADGNFLLWSDIPNNRVMRYVPDGTVDVFQANSNYANGHTRDREGRLVTCEPTAPSPSSPTPIKASASTRPTTSWSSPTARSGSPIRTTGS
jgi:hypothetical protein